MKDEFLHLSVKDRPRLLIAMMRALTPGTARIAFEGWLSATDLRRLEGASEEETVVMKRNTLSPRLDFCTLPLKEESTAAIEKAIHRKLPFKNGEGLIHVQIERDGALVFAAYDAFQHCIVKASAISETFLTNLAEQRILRAP